MTCTWCNGSGEREGSYGQLDCSAPNCTAATERAALEAANKAAEPMTAYDQRWFAYTMGKEKSDSLYREMLVWALEWIDAVPDETPLPGMPGFDRDYVNDMLSKNP